MGVNDVKNITNNDDYSGLVQLLDSEERTAYFNQIVFEFERNILRGDYNFTSGYGYGFLGDAEYKLLIDDLDSNNEPQTQKYIDLISGKYYTDSSGKTVLFRGIKEMLKLMVYSEFLKRDSQSYDGAGLIQMKAENADVTDQKRMRREAHIRWNNGVDLYNGEAYQYMVFYQSDFPNWQYTPQSKFIMNAII